MSPVRQVHALLLVLLLSFPSLAGGVVTDNSLTRLYAALLGGGEVTVVTTTDIAFNLVAPIEILEDTFINASGATRTITFNTSTQTRLFNVRSNATLTLANLTLTGGQSPTGGAIYIDAGGTLAATNCVFRGLAALGSDGADGVAGRDDFSIGGRGGDGGDGLAGMGGAIYSLGRCELARCRFENNRAEGGDGGDGGTGGAGGWQGGSGGHGGYAGLARGGAVFSSGVLLATECSFSTNTVTSGNGGGSGASGTGGGEISYAVGGYARAGADAAGGAVFNAGQATFLGCTFYTNRVTAGSGADETTDAIGWGRPGRVGGTAYGGAIANDGTLAMTNCTFVANAGAGGNGSNGGDGREFRAGKGGDGGSAFGGALWSQAHATLVNVTLVGGAVTGGTGGEPGTDSWERDPLDPWNGRPGRVGGGNLARAQETLSLQNCLVAHAVSGGNADGRLTDHGHNLSSDGTCDFGAPGGLNNTDPVIGSLGDFGGATRTVPLLVGSPAINAGTTIPGLALDQRGVSRPQGTAFDIGAFERPFAGLSGVVFVGDGSPVPGVELTLLSVTAAPRYAVTDATGRYEFTPVPDTDLGIYRIHPPQDGRTFSPAYRDVELTSASQSITGLDFTIGAERIVEFGLGPDGRFRFRFQGQPVESYRVDATSALGSWEALTEAQTDDMGVFDFTDSTLPTGTRFYRVVQP